MTGRQLRFYIIDVFAQEPLNGNPLALVIDAQDLSQQTMQRIVRGSISRRPPFRSHRPSHRPIGVCTASPLRE
jgi:hypothetical protein